jgi:hypothetical protein
MLSKRERECHRWTPRTKVWYVYEVLTNGLICQAFLRLLFQLCAMDAGAKSMNLSMEIHQENLGSRDCLPSSAESSEASLGLATWTLSALTDLKKGMHEHSGRRDRAMCNFPYHPNNPAQKLLNKNMLD